MSEFFDSNTEATLKKGEKLLITAHSLQNTNSVNSFDMKTRESLKNTENTNYRDLQNIVITVLIKRS